MSKNSLVYGTAESGGLVEERRFSAALGRPICGALAPVLLFELGDL
jgi:hypothetical protein